MKCIDWCYFSTRFIGVENLPKNGSFIIASNHISNIDPFILGISTQRKFSYVAKDSLFKNKFLAFFFRQVGAVPIKRDGGDFHALREVLKRIKKGGSVILFPEGTRGTGDRSKKIQPGVGLIAQKSDVPVIPAFIKGSDKGLPPGKKWFRRHPITVVLGKPLRFNDSDAYIEVAEEIMSQVYRLEAHN